MISQKITATVESIIPLTDSIIQVCLNPQTYVDYRAGQYLQIVLHGQVLSYSIANAPLGSRKYELHIRHASNNQQNALLLAEFKKGEITVQIPQGNCHLDCLNLHKPLLFIAGGTGFAPIKAMIEQLLASGDNRYFELIWGVRSKSDLYMDDKVSHWRKHVRHFQYYAHVTGSHKSSLTAMVLKKHAEELNKWQFVISGPFDMACSLREQLMEHGVTKENLFSDAWD